MGPDRASAVGLKVVRWCGMHDFCFMHVFSVAIYDSRLRLLFCGNVSLLGGARGGVMGRNLELIAYDNKAQLADALGCLSWRENSTL